MGGQARLLFLLLGIGFSSFGDGLNLSKRSASDSACPGVAACLASAQMILDFVDNDDIKTLHTLSYPTILDDVCGQKDAVTSCLQRTPCSVYEESYKGVAVVAAIDYICNAGRSDFLSEAKCFARDSAYNADQLCSKILLVGFDVYSAQIDAGNAQAAGFCKVFDSFLQCIHSGIERACTNKAANVLTATYRATITPMTNRVGCALSIA